MATVPTCQSETTIMHQPRQDDKSSQVEHANGLYMCVMIALIFKLASIKSADKVGFPRFSSYLVCMFY